MWSAKASTSGEYAPLSRWPPAASTRMPMLVAIRTASPSRRDLPIPGSPSYASSGVPSPLRWARSSAISLARPRRGPSGATNANRLGGAGDGLRPHAAAVSSDARSSPPRSSATARRSTVYRRGYRLSHSRLLIARTLRPDRCANWSWVRPRSRLKRARSVANGSRCSRRGMVTSPKVVTGLANESRISFGQTEVSLVSGALTRCHPSPNVQLKC